MQQVDGGVEGLVHPRGVGDQSQPRPLQVGQDGMQIVDAAVDDTFHMVSVIPFAARSLRTVAKFEKGSLFQAYPNVS